jgi:hypothetical protein
MGDPHGPFSCAEPNMPAMHPVRIGTCGWSYDDWKGVFYPKGTPSGD